MIPGMYSQQFNMQGCPWYMGPQGLALLREICTNLTQRKQELVWLSLPTEWKGFTLKLLKASYQDTAIGKLWISTHTLSVSWVAVGVDIKTPDIYIKHLSALHPQTPLFYTRN